VNDIHTSSELADISLSDIESILNDIDRATLHSLHVNDDNHCNHEMNIGFKDRKADGIMHAIDQVTLPSHENNENHRERGFVCDRNDDCIMKDKERASPSPSASSSTTCNHVNGVDSIIDRISIKTDSYDTSSETVLLGNSETSRSKNEYLKSQILSSETLSCDNFEKYKSQNLNCKDQSKGDRSEDNEIGTVSDSRVRGIESPMKIQIYALEVTAEGKQKIKKEDKEKNLFIINPHTVEERRHLPPETDSFRSDSKVHTYIIINP
jgi:hypothetical protein